MSRSYKRFPCWSAPSSDNGVRSYVHAAKRMANRKIRRARSKYWNISSGSSYKKITNSWDIRDWKWVRYSHTQVFFEIVEAKKRLEECKESKHKIANATLSFYKKTTLKYYYYAK